MFKKIQRNIFKHGKDFKRINIVKTVSCLVLAYTISLTPIYAQQIITNGNTNTNLQINGNNTVVTTTTIKGQNAFNSFSRFNVNKGNIVNLIVPGCSNNLINLVFSEFSNINGTLNSIKNNQIGGNIYLLNPHGIVIGAQGVINVGSLTAITPTMDYMNGFFSSQNKPADIYVNNLLTGEYPINGNANITNDGKINAINDVTLDTGTFYSSGDINTGAIFKVNKNKEQKIGVNDVVNVNTIDQPTYFSVNSGKVVVKTVNNIVHSGRINAPGGNNINAGKVTLTAQKDIILESGSEINAFGRGENSNGGTIYILADNDTFFNKNAIVNASAGEISGDGGFIELSAKNNVEVRGILKANGYNGKLGNVLIDPAILNISTNQFLDGANYSFLADNTINVANGIIISSRDLTDVNLEDHLTALSQGNSGTMTFQAPEIYFGDSSKVYSFANNDYTAGDVRFISNLVDLTQNGVEVNSGDGSVIFSPFAVGNYAVSELPPNLAGYNASYITPGELNKVTSDNIIIGNHPDTNDNTNNVYLLNSFNRTGNIKIASSFDTIIDSNVAITATKDVYISANQKIITKENSSITGNNILFATDFYDLSATGVQLNAPDGNVVLSRYSPGDYYIKDLTPEDIAGETEFLLIPDYFTKINATNLVLGNHFDTNTNTNDIFVNANVTGKNVYLTANNNIFGKSDATINADDTINLLALDGHIGKQSQYLLVNEGANGHISAIAKQDIYLNKKTGNMRIYQLKSTDNGDVFLATPDNNIINANGTGDPNVIANNLFIVLQESEQEFFFLGINGLTAQSQDFMDYYLSTLKNKGENWSKMDPANAKIFDNPSYTKAQILAALKAFADQMSEEDVFLIVYNGHGGGGGDPEKPYEANYDLGYDFSPVDELLGYARDQGDEYMSFEQSGTFYITDDEFASALKNSKGSIVFFTDQCHGGGMFGGTADLDHVANNNNFNYYSMTGTIEGRYGWGRDYDANGRTYTFIGTLHQNLLNTLTQNNPVYYTHNSLGEPISVDLTKPYSASNDVYLNDWYDAIHKGTYYAHTEEYTAYPESYSEYTNMNATELQNTPIIIKNWDPTEPITQRVNDIGSQDNALQVNLSGNLDVQAKDLINISGNWNSVNAISGTNNVILNGVPVKPPTPPTPPAPPPPTPPVAPEQSSPIVVEPQVVEIIPITPEESEYRKSLVVSDNTAKNDSKKEDKEKENLPNTVIKPENATKKAFRMVSPLETNFYLDDMYENYTRGILNNAVAVYNDTLRSTGSELKALNKTKQLLKDANFTSETIKVLLQRDAFKTNSDYVKIMRNLIGMGSVEVY